MKRYSMQYESDQICCGRNNHTFGYASTIKTAKQYISKCRKVEAGRNPRNFRIYDHYSDDEYAPVVYQED